MHLRRFTSAIMILEFLLLAGCATASKSDQRLHALELKLKRQRQLLQDLKERNLVLEKRSRSAPVHTASDDEEGESIGAAVVTSEPPADLPKSFVATGAPMPAVATVAHLPSKLPAKLEVKPAPVLSAKAPTPIAVSSQKTGEHYLYSKILDTYRTKNVSEMRRVVGLLLKSYPDSVFADNALYLSGLQAAELGVFKEALKNFDKLLHDYPSSNKAVAALFAKASVEKRIGRASEAKRAFLQVRDLYPGSPEAARVSVELKLLESASAKHRET